MGYRITMNDLVGGEENNPYDDVSYTQVDNNVIASLEMFLGLATQSNVSEVRETANLIQEAIQERGGLEGIVRGSDTKALQGLINAAFEASKKDGKVIHKIKPLKGTLSIGEKVNLRINKKRRAALVYFRY